MNNGRLNIGIFDTSNYLSLANVRSALLPDTDKIRKPFMVLQVANAPRVIQEESDELVAAARKNGIEPAFSG